MGRSHGMCRSDFQMTLPKKVETPYRSPPLSRAPPERTPCTPGRRQADLEYLRVDAAAVRKTKL